MLDWDKLRKRKMEHDARMNNELVDVREGETEEARATRLRAIEFKGSDLRLLRNIMKNDKKKVGKNNKDSA